MSTTSTTNQAEASTTEDSLEKIYQPDALESHWYQFWEAKGYFAASDQRDNSYCIMFPPPNVTGTLHMGHGFQMSLMDALIRYHRMCGHNSLWQVGTDHAGIATQMVVERQLGKEGKSRHDVGREAFVERTWEWKNQSDSTIKNQLRRMGASFDWDRECFTLDPKIADAVKKVFISLYDEGLIYRGKRLVNWDPVLGTAVSDLEVINKEVEGQLWHIQYPVAGTEEHLVVATTRPETMLGDSAVAVHPEDERYQHLVGQHVTLPLCNRQIPIIADEYVDRDFGSGCVKITPAHDFNDYDVGKRHELPLINIFTPDARLNENCPTAYVGIERFAARKQIIDDLKAKELLVKVVKHTSQVPTGDRSNSVIEPYLTDQWYVKSQPLAEPALKAVKDKKIQFIPENWVNTYNQWLENIEDWCISRQLWWGHRIPAWYDDENHVYVGHDETDVRKKYALRDDIALRQDEDVLDTWFSSALWPFVTLGWPEKTPAFNTFYPTNVLVTGFDIIFFWVARMIMMGLKFTGEVPFHQVYITGLIRDSEGQKMSKSKGNVLDPIDLIDGIELEALIKKRTANLMQPGMAEKITKKTEQEFPTGISAHGTDALRFTFCALATTGRDIRFDMGRIEGYRNFCNKLWNASRYVLMNTQNQTLAQENHTMELSLADKWIRTRLQSTIQETHQYFADYRFDLLAKTLYEFTWNSYCDWYLELSKPILLGAFTEAQQRATRQTLVYVLETLLRLIHPIMPFITEAIWQKIAPLAQKTGPSIMLQAFPEVDSSQLDQDAVDELEWLKKIIISIRTIRAEMNISPKKPITLLLNKGSKRDRQRINRNLDFLQTLAKIDSVSWLASEDSLPQSSTAFIDDLELHIPIAGLINKEEELARLKKELAKLEKELDKSNKKLNNPNYINKAPADVVEKERTHRQELEITQAKLLEQTQKMSSL